MISGHVSHPWRVLVLSFTAVGLAVLMAACSSPTPSTPGEAPGAPDAPMSEGGGGDPAGFATNVPPGGGEEYIRITTEPTEDLGYPRPATLTIEEVWATSYPGADDGDGAEDASGEDSDTGDADDATEPPDAGTAEGGADEGATDEGDGDSDDASGDSDGDDDAGESAEDDG